MSKFSAELLTVPIKCEEIIAFQNCFYVNNWSICNAVFFLFFLVFGIPGQIAFGDISFTRNILLIDDNSRILSLLLRWFLIFSRKVIAWKYVHG